MLLLLFFPSLELALLMLVSCLLLYLELALLMFVLCLYLAQDFALLMLVLGHNLIAVAQACR